MPTNIVPVPPTGMQTGQTPPVGSNPGTPEHVDNSSTPWHAAPWTALDTETTGTDPLTARLVSAAAVYDEPGLEPFTLEWLFNPDGQYEIPLEATAVHGISTEHAETHGSDAREVLAEILGVLTKAADTGMPVVIQNAPFDLTILDRECRRYGMPFPVTLPMIIDPMVLDRLCDPYRRGRRTLTAISASYGVRIKGAHQASGDCLCTLKLARAIVAKYPALRRLSLGQLQRIQKIGQRQWAANYETFRKPDDPAFTCSRAWPVIPFDGNGPTDG